MENTCSRQSNIWRVFSAVQAATIGFCLLWYYHVGKFVYKDNWKPILPPYVLFFKYNFLLSVITAGILYLVPGLPMTLNTIQNVDKTVDFTKSIAVGVIWGVWHMFIDGVTIMLLQNGIGLKSYLAGMKFTTGFALLTVVLVTLSRFSTKNSEWMQHFAETLWNAIMAVFYIFIAFAPSKYLFRRPAVYIYARFWVFLRFAGVITAIVDWLGDNPISDCMHLIFETIMFTTLQPIFLYQTFAKDSAYWRGEDILKAVNQSKSYQAERHSRKQTNNDDRSRSFETRSALHSPLLGIQIDAASTDVILEQADKISWNQEFLIDFRDLSLQESW